MNEAEKSHWLLFALALYISEGWYSGWQTKGRLHYKARAMVLFDQALNQELSRMEQISKR